MSACNSCRDGELHIGRIVVTGTRPRRASVTYSSSLRGQGRKHLKKNKVCRPQLKLYHSLSIFGDLIMIRYLRPNSDRHSTGDTSLSHSSDSLSHKFLSLGRIGQKKVKWDISARELSNNSIFSEPGKLQSRSARRRKAGES